jgi:hypothetical protein
MFMQFEFKEPARKGRFFFVIADPRCQGMMLK